MAQLIKIVLEVGVLEYHIIVVAIVLDLTPLQSWHHIQVVLWENIFEIMEYTH
jgi:hypothetical protein